MDQVKGVADLGIFRVLGQPNLNIKVDRDKAARYGLNSGDVNAVVQAALGGTVATTQLEADRQFNVTVRLAPEYRGDFESVGNIKVGFTTPSGTNAYIPLRELATISLDTGASYIFHERNARFIPIKFSVRGRDLGSTVAEAQERIARNITLADRLSDRMGGRVRGAATGQGTARNRGADQPDADPGAALRPVQFVARRPAGARRHSVLDRRRRAGAARHRTGFQHFRRDRIRVAVRGVGHERHPDHHLFQSGPRTAAWAPSRRCITPPNSGCGRC